MEKYSYLFINSADFFLPKPIVNLLNTNFYKLSNYSFYINGWTFIHFLSGMLLGIIYLNLYSTNYYNLYFYSLFIIHTIWELWQMLVKVSKPWKLTGDSNLIDTLVDTFVFMCGAAINIIILQLNQSLFDFNFFYWCLIILLIIIIILIYFSF